VDFDGPSCWCGGRGCLVVFASGRGIAEAARTRATGRAGAALRRAAGGDPGRLTAPMVFRAAAEGDAAAAAVIDRACRALAAMLGTIVNGLNPEVVVITGGVAGSLAPLEARIMKAAGEYAFAPALAATRVVIVPGDKRVTMRGAAALVRYETDDEEESR
jgi:predicted NBD/HSP70 family sugar kinase